MQKNKNNLYFLKIGLFVGLGLFYLFGLFAINNVYAADDDAYAYDMCSPFFQGFFNCDRCSYSGQIRCFDSTRQQVCGDYNSDSYLEWSSPRRDLRANSCGYGRCDNDERPYRYCSEGKYVYRCEYSSSCTKSSYECSEGPCCDGYNYKPSTSTCDFEIQTQYSCPWGSGCGANVGKRTRTKFEYCSGNSSQCTGKLGSWLSWTDWRTADSCGTTEVCSSGNSQCQYSSSCVSYTPKPEPEPEPEPKLEPKRYLKCDDDNALMLSLFERKENSSEEWKKDIKAAPGERIDFLLIITNSSSEDLKDVNVKVELPQEIIYRGNLKIGENPSEENISKGFNIDYLPSGAIETIIFKGEVASEIEVEERDIIGMINIENLFISDSDSTKIAFEKPQEQMATTVAASLSLKELLKKWYFWALLILGIIVLFSLIKRFSSKS